MRSLNQPASIRRTRAMSTGMDEGLRAHMNRIYATMSVGMILTGLVAWAIAGLAVTTQQSAGSMEVGSGLYLNDLGMALYASPLKWVILFAPFAFVFGVGAGVKRLSAAAVQTLFYAFAAVMGLSISSIFLVYTGTSIVQTFLVTAIAFAGLSLYGYTTKRNLSGLGSFLLMGLVGLIAAMILNIFIASSALQFAITVIGLLIFAGLTAHDTQKAKTTYVEMAQAGDREWLDKAATMGALSLYLDALNMFMFLLQFLGQSK